MRQPPITTRHPGHDAGALLTAALTAAGQGWPVFPVQVGAKRPALHGHDRCPRTGGCAAGHVGWGQRATTDPDRIRAAWSCAPFNIGIPCGPAGLVVVDLDHPRDAEDAPPPDLSAAGVTCGLDVLVLLADEAAAVPPLDTHTVTTASGGSHLYFTAPTGLELRNTAGERGRGLGWKVDTRAHGGYVLAAGSVVDDATYVTVDARPPAPLPAWLAERLAPPPLPPAPATPIRLPTASRRDRYISSAVAAEVARVEGASRGNRNQALYLAAVALGQLVAGGVLGDESVRQILIRAAAGALATEAYSVQQLNATITSGLRAGAKRPRQVAA